MAPDTLTTNAAAETGLLAQTGQPISLGDATIKVTQAAPGLKPATALTVASKGGTVEQNGQAVTHGHTQVARAKAAQDATQSSGGGLFGWVSTTFNNDVAKPFESAVSDAGKALNAPLQVVQHEYRYLRDVEARHGADAAIMEGLGMAAGAAVGTIIEPGEGTVLGAEAAGALEGQVTYKTSWARTTTGAKYKTPTTGDVISIGRTVARLLGMQPTTRNYSTLSGVLDGLSDVILTPLGQVGKITGAARSAEGVSDLPKILGGGQSVVGKIWGGIGLQSPEDVERAYGQYKSVRNAFTWIAQNGAGSILSRYGTKLAPIADQLGDASTAAEVKTVFKDVVAANELRTTDVLPTSTTASKAAFAAKTALGNTNQLPKPLELLMTPVAKTAKLLQTVPGGFIDDTGAIQTKLNPLTGEGALTIYKMARYSQSDRTARLLAESYVYAEPADRIRIFRNAVMSTIEARAYRGERLLDDPTADLDYEEIATPTTRTKIKAYIDSLTGGENPGVGGEYGKNAEGVEMGTLYTPKTDREFSQAILPSQAGTFSIPSYTEIKRMGTALRGAKGYLGRADTWLYENVTTHFFKRWVLQTVAYALHMAGAEQALNMLRRGVWDQVKAHVYTTYANIGYERPTEDDLAGFLGWAQKIHRPVSDLLDKGAGTVYDRLPLTERRMQADAQMYALTEGHPTPAALNAAHGTSALQTTEHNASRVIRDLSRKGLQVSKGSKFTSYDRTDPDYMDAWQQAAREMGRNEVGRRAADAYATARDGGAEHAQALRISQEAATDWLRNTMSAEERNLFPAGRMFARGDHPAGWDELDTWGNRIAQSMHGLISTDNDLGIAKSIANGQAPTMQDLEAVDPSLRPKIVKGQQLEVNPDSRAARIANVGFKHILGPIINKLSREPLFEAEYWDQYKQLVPQIERGELAEDEATQIAFTKAANKAIKFVHNVHTRTQWTETVRNWMPFAFAQEQAYKRAGRLLVSTPGAFRRYQLAIHGVGNYVAQLNSPTGTKYFALPGSGLLGKGVPAILAHLGMPLTNVTASITGSFTAANVIFPLSTGFRPDLSPLAVLAAKRLTAMFPEVTPLVTKVVGAETLKQTWWLQVIPNSFAQRAVETGLATHYGPFASTMNDAIQALDYEQNEAMQKWLADGRKGPKPDFIPSSDATPRQWQVFVSKVRNQTRVLFGMRAGLGLVSPVSPEVKIQTWGLRQDLQDTITKQGSVTKGTIAFLKKHPDATPYTVSTSYAETSGVPTGVDLTESTQAQAWYDANQSTIQEHPYGAAWLMPQPTTDKFNFQVYNEQLADHMRAKYSPEEFLDQLYISAGDNAYYANEKRFQTALAAAGNDKKAVTQLYQEWTQYKLSLAAASPIWATHHTGNQAKLNAQRSVLTLLTMLKKGLIPDSPQANAVKALLSSYETAEQGYVEANQGFGYAKAQSQLSQAWFSYLTEIKTSHPRLRPVIESVFEYALGTTNPAVAG